MNASNLEIVWQAVSVETWPPVNDDRELWVRDACGTMERATRDSTFTKGWLWWTLAPQEAFTGESAPSAITQPPRCIHGAGDCEAERIHVAHRKAFYRDMRALRFRDGVIDLLFVFCYDHAGEDPDCRGFHLFRARNRPLSPVNISLEPAATLEHVREAIYQAGRRDMRDELSHAWQKLNQWLGKR